jgi:photosystem II stability/assembly factor-like uncharacterized protein
MRKKTHSDTTRLTKLGGPPAGTVPALAIGHAIGAADETLVFAGTQVGVFRLALAPAAEAPEWERLANAPLGVLSLGVSPNFAQDHTVIAGTNNGIYVSTDSGDTWQAAAMPIASSAVVAISFSPNYTADGILLAGTMEDGIFYSNTRGSRWQTNGFGLLDASAFCLGFSPNFSRDSTTFAGTDTTLYFSYNGAMAWKQLPFPEGAAPALSLAVSPNFEQDQTLFVGTETQGLHRSTDRGRTWRPLDLPAACINVLLWTKGNDRLLAATDAGVFASTDQGETWRCLLDQPSVISLATAGELTLAGVVDQGVQQVDPPADAQALPALSARSVLGLGLSPQFDQQPIAFVYGPQEGLWRTTDGGQSWEPQTDELLMLSQDVAAVALAPDFATSQVVVAATPEAVLASHDAGSHWATVAAEGARLLAFSPNGQTLAASFDSGAVSFTRDLGQTWLPVPGPWDAGGRVAAMAVDDEGFYYMALLESMGQTLSLWFGQPDRFLKILSRAVADNPVVSVYVPPQPIGESEWFAACGNQVWKFDGRKSLQASQSTVFTNSGPGESILSLIGTQNGTGQVLLAGTGQHVYKLADGKPWRKVFSFEGERAIALALGPAYADDKTVHALLLGGALGQVVIR